MKQLVQSLKTGKVELIDVPVPAVGRGQVLIQTSRTLVSAGTERMLVEFGKANLVQKALQQPDKVKQVIEKIGTDGLVTTVEAVLSKLDQPMPLGYCNVGVVREVGAGVDHVRVGDRVVSNGRHAEYVVVPKNLVAPVPDGVDDETAAFTVLASIGLQGVRLAAPTLGESVVVIGLGLIGLMTVQLLRANGCKVIGVDFPGPRLDLARGFGASVVALGDGDAAAEIVRHTSGAGADAVIISAATDSDSPVSLAARVSRKRGRIVLVGVAGLALNRAEFYEKELSFQVSCSYGPGRYDPNYEEAGNDYPFGFVRWTEQRNFTAVLQTMASGGLVTKSLVSHRFAAAECGAAYDLLTSGTPSLGILMQFAGPAQFEEPIASRTVELSAARASIPGKPGVAFIGAGNYASRMLIPAFSKAGADLRTLVTQAGLSGAYHGRQAGFARTATDVDAMLSDQAVEAVVIATRHDSHADLVLRSLRAGKHVFVEKPLCLKLEELDAIESELKSHPEAMLTIGFNRRFSPLTVQVSETLARLNAPRAINITVNAGSIPLDSWVHDPAVGGGRLVGEGCHFIDLARHLAGAPVVRAEAFSMVGMDGKSGVDDRISIQLQFADGSMANVLYLSNGHASFPKERVEVFCAGRVMQIDNFRRLRSHGPSTPRNKSLWRQDKGQTGLVDAFLAALRSGGQPPIPLAQCLEVSRTTIELAERLRSGGASDKG
jgi:predicted dehydrogenase/threonine dehydrogenase-like Zn-dependent dehydrogenase